MERGPERSLFMLVTDPKALIIISNIFCLIQSGGSSLKALIMNYVKSKLTHEKQLFPQKKPPSSHTHTHTHNLKVQQNRRKDVLFEITFPPALVKCISVIS